MNRVKSRYKYKLIEIQIQNCKNTNKMSCKIQIISWMQIQPDELMFRLLQLVAMFMSIWWTAAGFIHLIGSTIFFTFFFFFLISFITSRQILEEILLLFLNNFTKIFLRRKLRWSPGFHEQSEPLLLRVKTLFPLVENTVF